MLGILDTPDEAAYEEHFAQCEQCRREFIEMADLPAILDTVKPAKPDKQGQPERQPALPPLDTLIDFRQLAPPGPAAPPTGPAVPPQQRPAGATQPTRIPPVPTNGKPAGAPTNGHARPIGPPIPAPKPAPGTGRHTPVPPPGRPAPRAESTGRSAPVARPGPEGTGRSAPVAATRAARPTAGTRPATTKPSGKPSATGPAGRRNRKPVWLAAAAVAALMSIGLVIGLTSGGSESGNQVAEGGTSTPPPTTSGAVAGAHVVSGTDPKSGVTAIITVEPVADGIKIDATLYEVTTPQEGALYVVSRFGDRERIATWKAPEGTDGGGEAIRASGVSTFAQHDISRFEVHGGGIEPLLVVPI
ncbi:hypothetical protein GCM10027436_75210 [Actinophytocola sediminis]